MGVGPIALRLYEILFQRNILAPGQIVLELGSQDFISVGSEQLIQGWFDRFARPLPQSIKSARTFMEALGFGYVCIDTDGNHGALKLDLNDVLPARVGPCAYDVVTNHGTTEHVFNQAQCFHSMHDLTKSNGVMVHCVPMRGYNNHCFYLYQPRLFIDLAAANNYLIEGMWVAPDHYKMREMGRPTVLVEWKDGDRLTFEDQAAFVLLCVVLRKRDDAGFKVPTQKLYRLVYSREDGAPQEYCRDE